MLLNSNWQHPVVGHEIRSAVPGNTFQFICFWLVQGLVTVIGLTVLGFKKCCYNGLWNWEYFNKLNSAEAIVVNCNSVAAINKYSLPVLFNIGWLVRWLFKGLPNVDSFYFYARSFSDIRMSVFAYICDYSCMCILFFHCCCVLCVLVKLLYCVVLWRADSRRRKPEIWSSATWRSIPIQTTRILSATTTRSVGRATLAWDLWSTTSTCELERGLKN